MTIMKQDEKDTVTTVDANERYRKAEELLRNCESVKHDIEESNKRFDVFLEYIHANFTPPKNDHATMLALSDMLNIPWQNLHEQQVIPPLVSDDVYPVMLLRVALCVYCIPVHTQNLKQFHIFYKRYSSLMHDEIEYRRTYGSLTIDK